MEQFVALVCLLVSQIIEEFKMVRFNVVPVLTDPLRDLSSVYSLNESSKKSEYFNLSRTFDSFEHILGLFPVQPSKYETRKDDSSTLKCFYLAYPL